MTYEKKSLDRCVLRKLQVLLSGNLRLLPPLAPCCGDCASRILAKNRRVRRDAEKWRNRMRSREKSWKKTNKNECSARRVTHICMLATGAAAAAKQRRHLGQIREHPYQRAGALSWIPEYAPSTESASPRAKVSFCTSLCHLFPLFTPRYFYLQRWPRKLSTRVNIYFNYLYTLQYLLESLRELE